MSKLATLRGPDCFPARHETLSETLSRAASDTPSHGITFVAAHGKEDFLSYSSLIATSRRYLGGLAELGVRAGDKVIISIDDSKEFFFAFWACVLGGIVPAPIAEPASTSENDPTLQKIVNVWHALGRPRILVDGRRDARWQAVTQSPVFADADLCPTAALGAAPEADIHRSKPDDLVLLQYSSGSTGEPKGVVLTNTNLFANNVAISRGVAITNEDVVFNWLPHTHDMGLIGQHIVPIFNGVNIVQLSPATFVRAPLVCLKKIAEHRATLFCCPNFGIDWLNRQIASEELDRLDLSSLRVVFNGAEPISAAVMNRFVEKFAAAQFDPRAMFPVYGMAEATLAVSFPPLGSRPDVIRISRRHMVEDGTAVPAAAPERDGEIEVVSEGTPVPGMAVRIVDENGNGIAENAIGEIQLKGPSVTPGYYENEDANAAAYQDGWFRTGDAGFINDGRLFVSGRLKDIVFVRGRNYYSHDIEEVLYSIGDLSRGGVAVVGSFNHGDQTEELIVFARHKGDIARFVPIRDKLIERLSAKLGLEVTHVVPIGGIPKTTSGKVQRFVLRKRYESGEFESVIRELDELTSTRTIDAPEISEPETESQRRLRRMWSKVLDVDERAIGLDSDFRTLGGNSLKAMRLLGELEQVTGSQLAHEVLLTCRTIRELDRAIASADRADRAAAPSPLQVTGNAPDPDRDIAITGLAVRFPFADTKDQFWDNLCGAVSCIAPVSDERKALSQCSRWDDWMGELRDIQSFDNMFFEIPEEEARFIDPQQRILLEMSYECLEDAGLSAQLDQESDIGVYVGISSNNYAELLIKRLERDALDTIPQGAMAGNLINIIAARVSHMFNFTGPSMSIDTACSSFMVATYEAIRALRAREVSGAVVASANLMITPTTHRLARKAGILSPTNRCKVFDREADGSALGEGAVVVFVERLADAIRKNKHVYGVIKGIAVNNDGCSLGVMAPNPRGQLSALRDAYRDAGISPAQVSYIEAHGTGTALGDPVELRALGNLFRESGARNRCGIGSVKSNVGHLLHAAGGAGLAKVLLCLGHETQVPTVGLESLNPSLEIEKSPFHVVKEVEEWRTEPGQTRKAGVSSFGFGGTNAHVVLEEYVDASPRERRRPDDPTTHLLTFSARSESSLRRLIDATIEWLARHAEVSARDICYTRNRFRKHWPHRAAFVFNDVADLIAHARRRNTVAEVTGYFDRKRRARTVCLLGDGGALESAPRGAARTSCAGVAMVDPPTAGVGVQEADVSALESIGISADVVVKADGARDVLLEVAQLGPDVVLVAGLSEREAARVKDYFACDCRVSVVNAADQPPASVVAEVWVRGGRIAWDRINPDGGSRLVPVPTYSFDRLPFWIEQ